MILEEARKLIDEKGFIKKTAALNKE